MPGDDQSVSLCPRCKAPLREEDTLTCALCGQELPEREEQEEEREAAQQGTEFEFGQAPVREGFDDEPQARFPWLYAALLGVAVVLVAGLVFWQAWGAKQAEQDAAAREALALEELRLAAKARAEAPKPPPRDLLAEALVADLSAEPLFRPGEAAKALSAALAAVPGASSLVSLSLHGQFLEATVPDPAGAAPRGKTPTPCDTIKLTWRDGAVTQAKARAELTADKLFPAASAPLERLGDLLTAARRKAGADAGPLKHVLVEHGATAPVGVPWVRVNYEYAVRVSLGPDGKVIEGE
jgi:hypothetical protein